MSQGEGTCVLFLCKGATSASIDLNSLRYEFFLEFSALVLSGKNLFLGIVSFNPSLVVCKGELFTLIAQSTSATPNHEEVHWLLFTSYHIPYIEIFINIHAVSCLILFFFPDVVLFVRRLFSLSNIVIVSKTCFHCIIVPYVVFFDSELLIANTSF